jgi:hypothetical protein
MQHLCFPVSFTDIAAMGHSIACNGMSMQDGQKYWLSPVSPSIGSVPNGHGSTLLEQRG